MQWQSDPFLGWTTIANRDYLVRQLNDHKASVNPEELQGGGLAEYAAVCGELLARGHARSGDVHFITGYLGSGTSRTNLITLLPRLRKRTRTRRRRTGMRW